MTNDADLVEEDMKAMSGLNVRLVRVEDGREGGAAEEQVGQGDGDEHAAGRALDGAECGKQATPGDDEEI